jgi:RNA polymerase sigma-70 factor (ECF subfamily)
MSEVDAQLSARTALALLSPAEREAIELLAWEGLTPAEAATVLGCSRGVVAVRLHRARRHLRRLASVDFEPRGTAPATSPLPADPPRRQEAT